MKNSAAIIIAVLLVLSAALGIFFLTARSTGSAAKNQATIADAGVFTLDDVSKHGNIKSCWMAIQGKIYDVTSFIPSHPGGSQILLGCGKDATQMFNSRPSDGISHSGVARSILDQYLIGTLKT